MQVTYLCKIAIIAILSFSTTMNVISACRKKRFRDNSVTIVLCSASWIISDVLIPAYLIPLGVINLDSELIITAIFRIAVFSLFTINAVIQRKASVSFMLLCVSMQLYGHKCSFIVGGIFLAVQFFVQLRCKETTKKL